jgi:hypothetical protein
MGDGALTAAVALVFVMLALLWYAMGDERR